MNIKQNIFYCHPSQLNSGKGRELLILKSFPFEKEDGIYVYDKTVIQMCNKNSNRKEYITMDEENYLSELIYIFRLKNMRKNDFLKIRIKIDHAIKLDKKYDINSLLSSYDKKNKNNFNFQFYTNGRKIEW